MKTLLLTLTFIVLVILVQAQTFAIIFGVNDDYTKEFCKELTQNGISWSLCDVLDSKTGKACNSELDIIAERYHLKAFDNLWLPIVLVRAGTREQGFNVAADRKYVMGKIVSWLITGIESVTQNKVYYHNGVIHNPERSMIGVYSIVGELMLKSDHPEINIQNFKPGIYIFRKGKVTSKFIKK